MADGRLEAEWAQTAEIVAALINVNRTKGKPVRGQDLNPFRGKSPPRKTETIGEVGPAFLGKLFGVRKPEKG